MLIDDGESDGEHRDLLSGSWQGKLPAINFTMPIFNMKKLFSLIFLVSTMAFATPEREELAPASLGMNGPVLLYTDSVLAPDETTGLFEAIIMTDTFDTIPKQQSLSVNCVDRTLRLNWVQASKELLLLSTRKYYEDGFFKPEPDSAYALLLNRVCP